MSSSQWHEVVHGLDTPAKLDILRRSETVQGLPPSYQGGECDMSRREIAHERTLSWYFNTGLSGPRVAEILRGFSVSLGESALGKPLPKPCEGGDFGLT